MSHESLESHANHELPEVHQAEAGRRYTPRNLDELFDPRKAIELERLSAGGVARIIQEPRDADYRGLL